MINIFFKNNNFCAGAVAYRRMALGMEVGEVLYSSIECVGPESRLVDCPRLQPGNRRSRQCVPRTDAGVKCPGKEVKEQWREISQSCVYIKYILKFDWAREVSPSLMSLI